MYVEYNRYFMKSLLQNLSTFMYMFHVVIVCYNKDINSHVNIKYLPIKQVCFQIAEN